MTDEHAINVENLSHRYGTRIALDNVSLRIKAGEIFALLGPNGSGKTTLFRILSTLMPLNPGEPDSVTRVEINGQDVRADRNEIRKHISVVFQSPSVDKTLTARENLLHHGHLYGLRGRDLRTRITLALTRMNLNDRANDRVETLSGGMRRRVEIAKCLLTKPKLLLLDEPGTGLDPAARVDLWTTLQDLSQNDGATVLFTTHLMDEADRASRIALLRNGKIVACDTPSNLKDQIGGDIISLTCDHPDVVRELLRNKLSLHGEIIDGIVRIEVARGHTLVPAIIEAAPGEIHAVTVGRPTLEDVFIHLTGERFAADEAERET